MMPSNKDEMHAEGGQLAGAPGSRKGTSLAGMARRACNLGTRAELSAGMCFEES
jgi:hypothetical protein